MTFWKWSQTASSNSNADATINAAEGMAPSAVNDSMRAMMAAAAKYRDDTAGSITTGGSATAYTITTSQSLTTLTAGFTIAFVPHATNTGSAPTLAVDGLTAKPIRTVKGSEIGAGVLVANSIYTVTYATSNSGEWILHSAPSSVPAGTGALWFTTVAPTGWLLLQGSAISRTTYADLFNLWTTQFGVGDGSTTFNLPNLIGRTPAGLDTAGTRLSSFTSLGATLGAQTKTITQGNLPSYTLSHTLTLASTAVTGAQGSLHQSGSSINVSEGSGFSVYRSDTISLITPTGTLGSSSLSGSVTSGGSGTAFDVTQPTLAVNFIVKY
jgi:microcystin-dependent protein